MVEDEESFYLIMEFAQGDELFKYIVKKKRLDEIETSYLFYQLINGLGFIHKNRISHRDLKPENLLLTKGQHKLLKIIDFGLSNDMTDESLLSTPCGSPCYAAPEMVAGKPYSGIKIDVWSCGVILFAMACGYLPFYDKNNNKLFKLILRNKIEIPSHVPFKIKDLIKKILVTNPQNRITMEQIKSHPVYLQGKHTFTTKNSIFNDDCTIDKRVLVKIEKLIEEDLIQKFNFDFFEVQHFYESRANETKIKTFYEMLFDEKIVNPTIMNRIMSQLSHENGRSPSKYH